LKKYILAGCLVFWWAKIFAIVTISINTPKSLLDTSITQLTISDVQELLKQACYCNVEINNESAELQIQLPDIALNTACKTNKFQQAATTAYFPYPEHDFKWTTSIENNKTIYTLEAGCWQSVSFGLYALLQEQMGFRFYHPREMVVPALKENNLPQFEVFEGNALFDKKGFHLHTQHPLELTEQLHDGTIPNALEDIKEYLNWLVRNGQTYFEFCLLESIDRKVWNTHAKAIVDYGHQRGLIMGIDLSLHMIQQKSFQLYKTPPKSFRDKKKQIEKNLAWLLEGGWDVLNVEFATAEFVGGNRKKKELLRLHMIDWLQQNSHAKLMGRKHVVKDENERLAKETLQMDSAQSALDKQRGILIHTVMFYDMTEPQAPVYENQNLQHMYNLLLQEKEVRETWYYPESAYWITFDNSIPLLLLPYLNARLSDIDTCIKHQIPGHITFSSGWEWGYWLFDWSIARWSWHYKTNAIPNKRSPVDAIELLFGNTDITLLMQQQLNLQQEILKDKNLIQWLTAMTVTDEMPFGLSQNYEPRPPYFYKDIANNISLAQIDTLRKNTLPLLQEFAEKTLLLCNKMKTENVVLNSGIIQEWIDGLQITSYRAQHRYHTLSYLLNRREADINKEKFNNGSQLDEAQNIRNKAQQIVLQRELRYRYSAELLGRKRYSHTAYHYGYLFPVSNLHFWNREEQQALRNKWNFGFMSIWDVFRIVGLKN
jgi:hypothetical protein